MTIEEETAETEELAAMRKRIEEIQRNRRKRKRTPKAPGTPGRGRPKIDPKRVARAKILAKDFSIPDVALVTGVSMSTMYRKGIKRYRLDREAATLAAAAAAK
jgi:DNA invertase Pin-like site-specific DNA recombinase